MGRSRGFLRFVTGGAPAALLATAAAMLLGRASAQGSCVQVSNTSFVPSCPCDAGSALTFGIEGQTTVTANTVNVAIVIDGSGSIGSVDFELSKDFAKNTVAAFADQNLFENGGTASFAQFSSSATLGGTFSSQEEFDAYVDAELQLGGGTDIPDGVARGRELLAAAVNTSTAFMVVLTDGVGGDPTFEADAARAEGTIVYAVGVGTGPNAATLLAIAGEEGNIFDVDDFTELGSALEGIISTSAGSIPCAATGATISLDFTAAAAVVEASVPDGSGTAVISSDGGIVTFELSGTLEATPTAFSVVLEFCNALPGEEIVASVVYSDDEGNEPDLSALDGGWPTPICDSSFTPAPVSPTAMPVDLPPRPTPVPVVAPTVDTSYEYSYDFSYTTDSWFDGDDDDATFSYPSGPGPSPSDGGPAVQTTQPVQPRQPVQTPQPVPQPAGPVPVSTVPPVMMPATPPTDPMFCDNGFYGIQSGSVCCDAGCGSCGGVGCSGRPGGAHACCITEIRTEGEECSVVEMAPCFIDDTASPPVLPPPTPTTSTADDSDDDVEYPASYSYDFYPTSWEDSDDSDSGMTGWCSNGVPGIESAKGEVCCTLGCGACGGVGCSRFGAPALDSYDCCVTEILNEGESCAATGEAPCYLDG